MRATPALRPLPSPEVTAKWFRGLGDPTRLRILRILREEGELTVGDLVTRLSVSQPNVSNHLACLRWCGFVVARREHRLVHNRLADERVGELLALGETLLSGHESQVAACCRIGEAA